MESEPDAVAAERALVARNVRRTRIHQGLSQTELAQRSGVDLASVYRVEKGTATRLSTLKKIAAGLNVIYADLLIDKIQPENLSGFAVHRASEAKWYIEEDRRQRVPPNQDALNQDVAERRRLGNLGLVPWFMCPPIVIPANGPGIVLLEVYAEGNGLEKFNAEFYEDGAIYVLVGEATVRVRDESADLSEGDWIAFKTKNLTEIRPTPPHDLAVILWIGATRLAKR